MRLIEKMTMLTESWRSDKHSSGSLVLEMINIFEFKPGGAVSESNLQLEWTYILVLWGTRTCSEKLYGA